MIRKGRACQNSPGKPGQTDFLAETRANIKCVFRPPSSDPVVRALHAARRGGKSAL